MDSYIADLHIHSPYSRATSKELTPENLDYYASMKGIKLMGTGDFTHSKWLAELKEKLEPAEDGLFRLKKKYRKSGFFGESDTRFLLTAEISNIYKSGDRVRKIHSVIAMPGFEAVEKFNAKLLHWGANLHSDGRPILGMNVKQLLEMALEAYSDTLFIPAHIWTPWFSMLGASSGFDSPQECFGDLWKYIYAVETGLSSDAPMNYMCSFLDDVALVSNSDAHSLDTIGRDANIFACELSYPGMLRMFRNKDTSQLKGTIDLFPQEGKYHYDGHRKCNVCWNPEQTARHNGICSECGKKITIGVMNRVAHLADRKNIEERPNAAPFYSIIPLKEILACICQVGKGSKKIEQMYDSVLQKTAVPELELLLNVPTEQIRAGGFDLLSEAIRRMRQREIHVNEGYDGEYGTISVFTPEELSYFKNPGTSLFGETKLPLAVKPHPLVGFDLDRFRHYRETVKSNEEEVPVPQDNVPATTGISGIKLNIEQAEAVGHLTGPALVLAGPGTGKTATITARILHLMEDRQVPPDQILAVTFTNKAATELSQRVSKNRNKNAGSAPVICTFHALGHSILREYAEKTGRTPEFGLIDETDKLIILDTDSNDTMLLADLSPQENQALQQLLNKKKPVWISRKITDLKQKLQHPFHKSLMKDTPEELTPGEIALMKWYETALRKYNLFDLDDMIYATYFLLLEHTDIAEKYRNRFQHILIDEYQDTNPAQYSLLRLLTNEEQPYLYAVGDPNQAIYGFRGADVRFIHRFTDDFPLAKVYRLKRSYRCPGNVLKASADVLSLAAHELLENPEQGVRIAMNEQPTEKSEAEYIAREIQKLVGGTGFFAIDTGVTDGSETSVNSLSEIAVLCRTHAQFESLAKAMTDHNIPYQWIGEKPFYAQEPVASLIDLIEVAANKNIPFKKQKLFRAGIISSDEDLITVRNLLDQNRPPQAIQEVANRFFAETTRSSLQQLEETVAGYLSLREWITTLRLGTSIDTHQNNLEAVSLMTFHTAKGLEFDCVFIAGCENGIVPLTHFGGSNTDIDEEKRLLYVAMTRAKRCLYLSYAQSRMNYGKIEKAVRSPFLNSIEQALLNMEKKELPKQKPKDTQMSLFN